jgi:serine phosphatase RsbU (regulator of sigma subunit)
MVLYTDGLTEARGRGDGGEIEEYGVGRLLDVAHRHRDRSAQDIVEALRADVRGFRLAATPQDDQTVLVVKRGTA